MRSRGASALPLWQEAAVVLLIVIRVVVIVRGVCDAGVIVSLMLLAACAWAVERRGSENGPSLNFRATRAPGILLGAMTPPLLMASRLAQAPGLERARVEFWSSIACSSTLLAGLVWFGEWNGKQEVVKQRNGHRLETRVKRDKLSPLEPGHKNWEFRRSVAVIGVLLVVMLQLGFGTGVIWSIVNAAGSIFFFRYFLQSFPCCTSAGEAMLVAHGFTLYFSNSILEPSWKLLLNTVKPELMSVQDVDPVLPIVHAIVLGMLLVPLLYKRLLRSLSLEVVEEKEPILESAPRAALFCFTVLAVVLWIAPAWSRLVVGVPQHPVLWILRFLMNQPFQRVGLCVYWVLVIGLFLHQMTLRKQMARIMIRKVFHIMAVVMFVPALAFQADFLRISFALAFGVFVLVETIRVWRIPPLGEKIHSFLKAFTDSRDSDVLIISHFSLLLGCAIPVWLSSTDRPLAAYAGILSLGIGDTMASVVGYNFGSMRLSSSSKKTWEGTIAGILSIFAASVLVSYMLPAFPLVEQIGSMAIAAICAGLVEAFTSQLDNAFVPIVYYSLLSL